MEYIDGPTLAELIAAARRRERRIAPPMAAYVCAELLKGLDYAHRKGGGVVHRDLSPRNVMISREGEVKMVDFGLSAAVDDERPGRAPVKGRPAGSFPYMSPEQVRGEPLDARTDLFSAGILLWEALTGRPLFARDGDDETLKAVLEAPIEPPSALRPDVPAMLDLVCRRALARDRDKRFASAADFLAALTRYLYTVEPPVSPSALSAFAAELCPARPLRAATDGASAAGSSPGDDPATRPHRTCSTPPGRWPGASAPRRRSRPAPSRPTWPSRRCCATRRRCSRSRRSPRPRRRRRSARPRPSRHRRRPPRRRRRAASCRSRAAC
jgi:serine/threonine-protein kinase